MSGGGVPATGVRSDPPPAVIQGDIQNAEDEIKGRGEETLPRLKDREGPLLASRARTHARDPQWR